MGGWLFIQPDGFTITPCHRDQGQRNSFSYLHGSELLHVTSIHSGAPPLPFPWNKGCLAWVSSKISSMLPFSRGANLHGWIDLRRYSRFGLVCLCFFCMLLPSSSEGYYNPSAHHPGFQQQLIYYSGAYIVWEEGALTCGGWFGVSPYSSNRILACWDQSLHHQLIYILVYVHALISPIL